MSRASMSKKQLLRHIIQETRLIPDLPPEDDPELLRQVRRMTHREVLDLYSRALRQRIDRQKELASRIERIEVETALDYGGVRVYWKDIDHPTEPLWMYLSLVDRVKTAIHQGVFWLQVDAQRGIDGRTRPVVYPDFGSDDVEKRLLQVGY